MGFSITDATASKLGHRLERSRRPREKGAPSGDPEPLCSGVHFVGAAHGLSGFLGELVLARDAVKVGRPLKFGGCVAVAGFVKEPPSDVVPHIGFFRTGGGQLQGLFLEYRGIVPEVLPLIDLG